MNIIRYYLSNWNHEKDDDDAIGDSYVVAWRV